MLASLLLVGLANCNESFTDIYVKRAFFLTSPIVRYDLAISTIRNGNNISPYIVPIPKNWNVTSIKPVLIVDDRVLPFDYVKKDCPQEYNCIAIKNLPRKEEEMIDMIITMTIMDLLAPHPPIANQLDPLIVGFELGAGNFFSFYKTEKHAITFNLSNEFQLVSLKCPTPYSKEPKPINHGQLLNQYTCGSYTSNLFEKTVHIKFKYSQPPFVRFNKVSKEITLVPLLSKVLIQERYEISHIGFKSSSFSRFKMIKSLSTMLNTNPFSQIVGSLPIIIPKEARNLEFRDDLGIITTNWSRRSFESIDVLDAVPRFPLTGGWNASFKIFYDLPLNKFMKNFEGGKSISFPFVTFGIDVGIAKYNLKVNLPEDASEIQYRYNDEKKIKSTKYGSYKTYFSTRGERTIEFEAENLTKEHESFMMITFNLPWWSIMRKPIFIISLIVVIITLIKLCSSRKFSTRQLVLASDDKPKSE